MGKLVRDRIPELIEKSGKKPIYHRAHYTEIDQLLKDKLFEEINEFLEAKTSMEKLEEAADIYEVLTNMLFKYGFIARDLLAKAEDKRFERGAFIKAYVLEGVEECNTQQNN